MASVVVAEDDVDHRRAIAEVVRRLGHQVTVAGDGREGLAAVAAHRPDLVVADVDMPHLDGLELCRRMHADPGLAAIPVVLVTAYLPPGDPRPAAAGAAAVVHKPFTVPDLTAALRPHLDAAGRSAPADPAGPALVDVLLQTVDAGVAVCDAAGRTLRCNPALRALFGEHAGDVPQADWARRFALRHPDGTPLDTADLPLVRALGGDRVHHADLLADDRHGRRRRITVDAAPVCDPGGAVRGAVAAVRDVTAEHRARLYHRCTTEVLRVLADTPDPAAAADAALRVLGTTLGWGSARLWLVDEVTDRLRPAASWTGPDSPPLPLPTGFARGHGLAGQAWQRGEPVWVPDVRAAGSPVLPEVAAVGRYRAAGAVPVQTGAGVIGVLTFFTADHLDPDPALAVLLAAVAGNLGAHHEQRRARELAVRLEASTDEYIALVGHELRTPLTSIGAYTELIAGSADDTTVGEVRDLLAVVERNNTRLRELVEKLLDLAALDSGHATLAAVPLDLAELVTAAAADAVAAAAAAGRAGAVAADPAPGVVVVGDPDRLRQVVDGLLDNALRYGPPGGRVTVGLTADGDTAVLTVADEGAGIPPDEQPHLFRRLYRGAGARHSGTPGTGLGLALSRVVVERHHGTITLDVQPGTGTTVTVRLPRVPPAAG